MAAEQPAGRDRRQAGQPQQAARPRSAGDQRGPVERGGGDRARRVHHPHPHLLLVLLGPVGRPRQRARRGHGEPGGDQAPGCLLIAAGEVQDAGRQPGADGGLDQHGVQRVPEPHAVQHVARLARPDEPGHALASGYNAV